MIIKTFDTGSKEYEQMIDLRIHALLEPIGVPASYIDRNKEKDDILIGAFEGDQIIGCCVLTPHNNGLVQLRQMAVHPDRQGQKIGASILQFAEKTAREHGFTTLMMHARNPVIGFYRKCGYEIAGEEFFEVGIGHHRMEKKLEPGNV
jgi:N-acetylglutamate synthase-like GNAT family acetyltransferase